MIFCDLNGIIGILNLSVLILRYFQRGVNRMLKKLGFAFVLAFVVLVAGINVQTGAIFQVQACRTIPECREQANQVADNIADLTGQEAGVGENLAGIQNEISQSRTDIALVESRIRALADQIGRLEDDISELREEIDGTRETIEETDARIEDLIELISRRMRATQRLNNSNSTLAQLSAAENLNDFVQVIRYAQRAANNDALMMEELSELIELNHTLYANLQLDVADLEERTEHFLELQTQEEGARVALAETQRQLIEDEQRLQDQLDSLADSLRSEEERLAIIHETAEVLSRVPAPNAYGLAHPMPGATVTSRFGPRWGTWHSGIDVIIPGNVRAPVHAAAAGVVTSAAWDNSMGWWIIISHNINDQRVDTVYAHLRYAPPVNAGDIVQQGQVIGIKGNTGHSYGPHLHFEVHPGGFAWGSPRGINPEEWIQF